MNLVLDSSVIVKLFIKESDSDEAIKLLEECTTRDIVLIALNLVFYEVGNTLLKHLRKKDKKGRRYMEQLFLLNIEYCTLDQNCVAEAMKIAQTHDITYYDAVHIVVSQKYESALVTQDKELLTKFENTIPIKEALERIKKEPTLSGND